MQNSELREMRDGDLDGVLDLARKCFGPDRAKDRGAFEWAFQRPGIERRGFVAVRDGQVLGAYLGIAQRMWIGGEERWCVQPVDLMVDPEARRGLQQRGLYLELASAFIDGYGTRGTDALHYGWPIPAARRSGQRLLGYELLREEMALVRDLTDAPRDVPGDVIALTEFGEDMRWLWDRCAGAWGGATIRDADWVRWRFVERPDCDYHLLGVHDGECLRGFAALRETPWEVPDVLPLCDWLVPGDEPEVAEWLEAGVRQRAAELGATHVATLLPDSSTAFASFQELSWRVRPTAHLSVVRSYDSRYDVDWLRRHWWYTLADSDLA